MSMDREDIPVSASAVQEYNYMMQSTKPEGDRQFSFEKLGIKDWSIREITGRELLAIQGFVETSGVVSPAYAFWKFCGKNISLGDIVDEVEEREEDIPENAKSWVKNILVENFHSEEIEEKIKNGEIDPPLIFIPTFMKKELENGGLLNLGNILDGNHRLMEVAKWLKGQSPEDIDNFKITAFVGKVDFFKYLIFNLHYILEKGQNTEEIYNMRFFEKWYLLLQRSGYYKKKN